MALGSIYKKQLTGGRVRYEVYYDLGPDPVTGERRQRKKVFKTKREAETFLTAQRAAVANGTAVDRSTMTVRELMQYWLENCARHRVSAATLEGYAATVRVHIVPSLGNVEVQKLTPARVQAFYTEKITAGCGPRTVELCHQRLSQALDEAAKLGWVPRNVTDLAPPPRVPPHEMETWTVDEARRFLSVAHESAYGPLWVVALATGLRRGELLGLRWQDVDFDRSVLTVRQTVGRRGRGGSPEIKPPKTPKSRRQVTIPHDVLAALREHRRRQLERRVALGSLWQDHDLVFAAANGNPVWPDNLRREYDRLVQKAGVKRIRIHDCRHSYATLALATGAHVKVVSEALGHADVATTLRIYAHVLPAQQVELAQKVGAALFGPAAAAP